MWSCTKWRDLCTRPRLQYKMCGTLCLLSRIPAKFASSPLCNVGRLFWRPFLTNNIAWGRGKWGERVVGGGGGGGGGRIWPKERLFPCGKRSMVEALHSARLSHISLSRIIKSVSTNRLSGRSGPWARSAKPLFCTRRTSYVLVYFLSNNSASPCVVSWRHCSGNVTSSCITRAPKPQAVLQRVMNLNSPSARSWNATKVTRSPRKALSTSLD